MARSTPAQNERGAASKIVRETPATAAQAGSSTLIIHTSSVVAPGGQASQFSQLDRGRCDRMRGRQLTKRRGEQRVRLVLAFRTRSRLVDQQRGPGEFHLRQRQSVVVQHGQLP